VAKNIKYFEVVKEQRFCHVGQSWGPWKHSNSVMFIYFWWFL